MPRRTPLAPAPAAAATAPARPAASRRRGALLAAAGAGLLLLALAGCAEPAPATSSTAAAPSATTTASAARCADDELPVQPFGCERYTSTGGTDASGELAWLASDPLTLTFRTISGAARVSIGTPCNTLGVPISTTGSTITPDSAGVVTTLMACEGSAATRERWALTHLTTSPITYSLNGTDLELTTGTATVRFSVR